LVNDPCQFAWSSAESLFLGKSNGVPLEEWVNERQRAELREISLDYAEINSIESTLKRNLPYASIWGIWELQKMSGAELLPKRTKLGTGENIMLSVPPSPN